VLAATIAMAMLAYSIIALMMEVASTSETSVNFYQTTRRYNPEDSHLNTRRRENLKSHATGFFVLFCLKVNLINVRHWARLTVLK
jgi:hypothetical protein